MWNSSLITTGESASVSRRALLRIGGWAAGLMALVGGSSLGATPARAAQSTGIEGTWVVNVIRPGLPPVAAVLTFGAGGTVTHTDSNILRGTTNGVFGATNDGYYSPGHGTWEPAGGRDFEYVWIRLNFDADRNYIGTHRVRGRITLDPDGANYSQTSVNQLLNLQGQVTNTNEATGRAARLTLDPMA